MNSESYLKSNIACNIVGMMFQEDGYTVIPFRDNYVLDRLAQLGVNNTKIAKLLFNAPSLIVVDNKKEPIFVSVKYRGREKSGRNIDWGSKQLDEYWPNTLIVIVANYEPCFSLLKGSSTIKLTESSVLKINKKTSDKYAHLIKKFLLD